MQKAIRKARKAGTAPPPEVVAGLTEADGVSSSQPPPPAELTTAGSDFLEQMRTDAKSSVAALKAGVSAAAAEHAKK